MFLLPASNDHTEDPERAVYFNTASVRIMSVEIFPNSGQVQLLTNNTFDKTQAIHFNCHAPKVDYMRQVRELHAASGMGPVVELLRRGNWQ